MSVIPRSDTSEVMLLTLEVSEQKARADAAEERIRAAHLILADFFAATDPEGSLRDVVAAAEAELHQCEGRGWCTPRHPEPPA